MRSVVALSLALASAGGIGFVVAQSIPADASPEGVPRLITYEGYLSTASGPAADATYTMYFSLWDSPTSTNVTANRKWTATLPVLTTDGHFAVTLGTSPTIDPALFARGDLYLQVAVGSETATIGRQRLTSVPYALRAATAYSAAVAASASGTLEARVANAESRAARSIDGAVSTRNSSGARIEFAEINLGDNGVYVTSSDWIASMNKSEVGLLTINFAPGTFTSAPTCTCSGEVGVADPTMYLCNVVVGSLQPAAVQLRVRQVSGGGVGNWNGYINLICAGND